MQIGSNIVGEEVKQCHATRSTGIIFLIILLYRGMLLLRLNGFSTLQNPSAVMAHALQYDQD